MNTRTFTLKQARVGMALSLLLLVGVVTLQACRPASSAETNAPTPPEAALPPDTPHIAAASAIDAGRYIVRLGGCNDCHTPGFMEAAATMPESEWLTGTPLGFRGPWGTTYPSNLRLRVQDMDENAWVEMLKTRHDMPPMPWPSVNSMSAQDTRAIYQFIKSLGPKGERAPAAVPPGQEPATPYILFEPQHMERMQPQG